jgi:hypothetical protein
MSPVVVSAGAGSASRGASPAGVRAGAESGVADPGGEPVSTPGFGLPASKPPPVPPTVVVAGTGHHDLVAALIAHPLPVPPAGAYLVLAHGAPAVRAYIPGHRRPRALAGAPLTRPPRRVVLSAPAPALRHVHLVLAPDAPPSPAGTEVLVDAVRRTDGLVYLLDAGEPLAPERREQLAALASAAARLLLVDDRATAAERDALVRQVPALAGATWHRSTERPALLAAVVGAGSWPAAGPVDEPAPATPAGPVRVTDDDVRWRAVLAGARAARQEALHEQVATELSVLDARCGADPGLLPDCLDIELHALSLRLTAALDEAARSLVATVFAEVVTDGLSEPVKARAVTAVRRQIEPDERTLLVTATSGVAAVAGSADALSATGVADETVVPAVHLAVSGNCHLMWRYRGGPDKAEGRRWLQLAVRALDAELARVVRLRFDALAEAVESLAADAVDHGVLLA